MTGPQSWSDRWSGRVEPALANREVGGRYRGDSAPESLSSHGQQGDSRRRPRTSARRLLRLQDDLSDRERAVLRSLAGCRLMTTGQLQRLHFADHATESAASRICRRVLARLQRLSVIEHLERRIGGIRAGSASYVWRVGPVGERLLRQDDETPRGRHKQPGLRFVDHVLAIAECSVGLVEADQRGDLELVATEHEPDCWRSFLGSYGSAETLKPDLYAVTANAEYEDSWFIEVDRGTESLPTVLKKCAQYERYQKSGREQAAHGVFPAVLWVVPDDERASAVAAAIRRRYGTDQELFRVTTTICFLPTITGTSCTSKHKRKGGYMETEQLSNREHAVLDVAWQAYQLWTGTTDETGFRRSYLGHYGSRDAFGQELIHKLGADSRLLHLPDWLRAYLRFDGKAVLRDFEAAGDFWVYDAPDEQGCFVFDPYERPAA